MSKALVGAILATVLLAAAMAGVVAYVLTDRGRGPLAGGRAGGAASGPGGEVEALRRHAFWKAPPPAAKLEETADLLCHPGAVESAHLADDGDVWWAARAGWGAGGGAVALSDRENKRHVKVSPRDLPLLPERRTRAEALRLIKEALDARVQREDFERRAGGGD